MTVRGLLARENPFAVHRVLQVRSLLSEAEWERLLARVAALRWRAAIVGAAGSGKTTLLEDLAARLTRSGVMTRAARVGRGERRLGAAGDVLLARPLSGVVLLVDSADELGPLAWRRLVRSSRGARGLIVTARRLGRLPTLTRQETSPELLAAIVSRLAGARAALLPAADDLHARHRGDLRAALRELYDYCAACPADGSEGATAS